VKAVNPDSLEADVLEHLPQRVFGEGVVVVEILGECLGARDRIRTIQPMNDQRSTGTQRTLAGCRKTTLRFVR
jgi:hypothetical protein